MNLLFPKGLQSRITKRAAALEMTPIAYVRQCVESELGKARLGTLTAGKDTPALNGVKKDFGCGAGYRWVGHSEVLKQGDQYNGGSGWIETAGVGYVSERSRYYRRKV